MLISAAAYRKALVSPDLTDAAYGPHALQLLVHDAVAALRETWDCDVIVHRAHPLGRVADELPSCSVRAGPRHVTRGTTRYVERLGGPADAYQRHDSRPAAFAGSFAGCEDVLLACPDRLPA